MTSSFHTAHSSISTTTTTEPNNKDVNVSSSPNANDDLSFWDGTLIARILPNEYQDFQNRLKPTSSVVQIEDTTPLCNQLPNNYSTASSYTKLISQVDPVAKQYTQTIVSLNDENSSMVELNLHVSHPTKEGIEVQMQMNRNGSEEAYKTLRRLQLSTVKKANSFLPKAKKKKKKVAKKMNRGNSTSQPEENTFFFTKRTDNQEEKERMELAASTTCIDLIQTIATVCNEDPPTRSLVGLSLPNPFNENESDADASSSSLTPNISLSFSPNPPTILSISTFEQFDGKVCVGIPVVIQMELLYSTHAIVSWFVNGTLIQSNSPKFIPQSHHVGKSLSVLIIPIRSCHDGRQCQEAYQFRNKIETLPYMPIVSSLRKEWTQVRDETQKRDNVRVVTYNILADLYVGREENDVHTHTAPENLHRSRRMPMIVGELLSYDADIICLQEVDGSVYDSLFEPVFGCMGYDGFYSNKVSCQREGCALFWARDGFEFDDYDGRGSRTFSVRDLFGIDTDVKNDGKQNWESMKDIQTLLTTHDELRRVTMEKIGQVLQIATLRIKDTRKGVDKPEKIVVANTHLFYHPMADHIRAMQVYAVCKKIDEIRRRESTPHPYPLILCGDLNSDPLSGAATLLFTRSVLPDHHDCWKYLHKYKWEMGESEYMLEQGYVGNEPGTREQGLLKHEEEAFTDSREELSHHGTDLTLAPPTITLPPCFPNLISGSIQIPKFTNYAVDFVDCLDYVLASEVSENEKYGFSQKKSARMPSENDIKPFIALPNECMPSDHISVLCDLEFDSK